VTHTPYAPVYPRRRARSLAAPWTPAALDPVWIVDSDSGLTLPVPPAVSSWADQAVANGAQDHLQSSAPLRPDLILGGGPNGRPALEFSQADNENLRCDTLLLAGTPVTGLTWYGVTRADAYGGAFPGPYVLGNTSGSYIFEINVIDGIGGRSIAINRASGATYGHVYNAAAWGVPGGTWGTFIVRWGAGVTGLDLESQGVQRVPTSIVGVSPAGSLYNAVAHHSYIGRGFSASLNGRIAAMGLILRRIDDAERVQLRDFLRGVYATW
jgi:hypothetical protein